MCCFPLALEYPCFKLAGLIIQLFRALIDEVFLKTTTKYTVPFVSISSPSLICNHYLWSHCVPLFDLLLHVLFIIYYSWNCSLYLILYTYFYFEHEFISVLPFLSILILLYILFIGLSFYVFFIITFNYCNCILMYVLFLRCVPLEDGVLPKCIGVI